MPSARFHVHELHRAGTDLISRVVCARLPGHLDVPPNQSAARSPHVGVLLVNLFRVSLIKSRGIASLQKCPDLFQAQPFARFRPDNQFPGNEEILMRII